MIKKLKPKSEFSKNVLTLMTGTTIAQAIPIAISPILTRIYTPKDFGILALFVAITYIFGSIANGRYELAIMLPKKDEDAINIFALGFIITCAISFFLLVTIIMFHDFFVGMLNNKVIDLWLYLVPVVVFLTGIFNLLTYYNSRKKNFKDLAEANVVKSIVLAITQILVGFLKQGASGLISGQILSQFFVNTKLFRNMAKDKPLISKISKVKIIALAKRYKDFPKFSMWAILANISSYKFVDIFMTIAYSINLLGFYSLAERVLWTPMSLIGTSLGQVYYQKASLSYSTSGGFYKIFLEVLTKNLLLASIFTIFLFFFAEDLIAIVFGEGWKTTGTIVKELLFLFFCRFLVAPLTFTPMILNRVKIEFLFQFIMLFVICTLLIIRYYNNLEFFVFLYLFSFSLGIYYLSYLMYLLVLVRNNG